MKVTVVGTGYVGLVTGACLAEMGNHVVCLDIDERKINMLKDGRIPIHEPGLEPIVQRNAAAGRLSFTTDIAAAVGHGTIQFIGVGTPPDEDGSADLQYVLAAARNIGRHMTDYKVVVDKSTVPVGTADKVRARIAQVLAERGVDLQYAVVSNPEFLKEGAAIDDFMKPDRIVCGVESERAKEVMTRLYKPFTLNGHPVLFMDVPSAEMTRCRPVTAFIASADCDTSFDASLPLLGALLLGPLLGWLEHPLKATPAATAPTTRVVGNRNFIQFPTFCVNRSAPHTDGGAPQGTSPDSQ